MEVLSFTIWAGGALRDMEVMASRGLVAPIQTSSWRRWSSSFTSSFPTGGEGSTTIFVKRMEVPPTLNHPASQQEGRREVE